MFEFKNSGVLKKNKNFTENSKSKKGHNSSKNEFRVIFLVCTYSPFYIEHLIVSFKHIFSVMTEV